MEITHNLDSFLKGFQAEIEARDKIRARNVRKVAVQALADLQSVSPVDKGRYRASHDLTIEEVSDYVAPENTGHGKMTREAAERLDAGQERLGVIRDKLPSHLVINITNNLDYALPLEEGHSKQAPEGVYGIVAERAKRNVERLFGRPLGKGFIDAAQ